MTAFFLTRSVECNSNLNTCSATAFIMIALINLAIKVVRLEGGDWNTMTVPNWEGNP